MYFGGRNVSDAYQNGWACKLDEVSIFNTAKDATWVSNAYNSGKPTDLQGQSGLVGYWKFNEGSGNTVKDYGPYGKDGTLTSDADQGGSGTPTWEKNESYE